MQVQITDDEGKVIASALVTDKTSNDPNEFAAEQRAVRSAIQHLTEHWLIAACVTQRNR